MSFYILNNSYILSFFLLFGFVVNSQNESESENYYIMFDQIVSYENTNLYNGTRYAEKYRTRNNDHKFYLTSEYLIGNIEYDGQTYFGIEIKYDISEEKLLVNLPSYIGHYMILLLNSKIEKFYINNSIFVKLIDKSKNLPGFYEVIFESPKLRFYKKYLKFRSEYFYKKKVYNSFENKDYYILYQTDTYHRFKSYKDLIRLFPELKKELNDYSKSQKKLKKSNYDLFMKGLINRSIQLITNKKIVN